MALEGAGVDELARSAEDIVGDPDRATALARALCGDTEVELDDPFTAELVVLTRAACMRAERYRQMLEQATDGIYIIDGGGHYVDVNASGAAMLGFTKQELYQQRIVDLVHPEDPPIDLASVRGGESILRRRRIRRKDGGFMLAELSSHMLSDGTIVGIARDITERERAERELRDVTTRLQQALRAARAGTWEADVETGGGYWSDESYRLLGFEPGSVVPSYDIWLECIHPEDRELASEAVARARRERNELDVEYRIVLPDDSVRWVRAVGTAILSDDGRTRAMYGIQMDITDSKEAALARAEAESRLHQAHRMEAIGRLAGGIAHDFNNLLTVILAAAEVVADEVPEHGLVGEHLESVRQAATRGAALTRQLLVLSRHRKPQVQRVDLGAQIRRMVPILQRLLGEDVELVVDLARGSWPVRLDPSQLDQVLFNLAINARDAMPQGGRFTFAVSAADGGDTVVLTVSDDGVGMDESTRSRVFEPFFTTKPEGTGTGLGLATVYGIVAYGGGVIDVESALGRGTSFQIRFPAAEPLAPVAPAQSDSDVDSADGAVVLVVEDESGVRRTVRRILESVGHRVLVASNGSEALEVLEAQGNPPDAVLSDVVMPGMSGPELTSRLRERWPGLPVLLMSGYLGDVLERHHLAADVALLEKPFTPSRLLDALARALAQSPRSASTSSS